MIRITFADTGPGMSAAQQARAFTGMLSSTKEKGAGLGLAIVNKVTEAHGGRVEMNSDSGAGTEITIHLPA